MKNLLFAVVLLVGSVSFAESWTFDCQSAKTSVKTVEISGTTDSLAGSYKIAHDGLSSNDKLAGTKAVTDQLQGQTPMQALVMNVNGQQGMKFIVAETNTIGAVVPASEIVIKATRFLRLSHSYITCTLTAYQN